MNSTDNIQGPLEKVTKKLEQREKELAEALSDLKATQKQLVQQEKLASLGKLTAGIAHEIKNPLNFVNNFSDLSLELIQEIQQELEEAEADGKVSLVQEILLDVETNLKKILEHGQRADSIVKSMLLQSRGKSGDRIPTDLNNLLDEYVRLAYHGMRAADNSFNVDIQTSFDPEVGKLELVAQDLSRAFLNIMNNAMYAAYEHAASDGTEGGKVKVQTKNKNQRVEIRIWDNGPGIPKKIQEQIFEPFFTTKPTGVGTGLGLSMSYEIIKQHNGEICIDSEPGVYTEFLIVLPKTE